MREENPSENGGKVSKFADQNQMPKLQKMNNCSNGSKTRSSSSWGSQIVKGFSADKKTKVQNPLPAKKAPLTGSNMVNQKDPFVPSHSRIKRSLIADLSCSANQVHPQVCQTHRRQSSRDLFMELDHLRTLLEESRQREFELQEEIDEHKQNPISFDFEIALQEKRAQVDGLVEKVSALEAEKAELTEQLAAITSVSERQDEFLQSKSHKVEVEVVELKRLNKELQLQKRNLVCKIASLESELASLAESPESEIVVKIKAEASLLRHTNEDLCKQVEGLQMSRLNEVEELAYLRWVNSCLRNELRNSCSTPNLDSHSSPCSVERSSHSSSSFSCPSNEDMEYGNGKRLSLVKKLKKWPITDEDMANSECLDGILDKNWSDSEEGRSPRRRHSISGVKWWAEESEPSTRRQSDGFICSKDMKEADSLSSQKYNFGNCQEVSKLPSCLDVEKRALRVANPPPRPSSAALFDTKEEFTKQIPPPLPLPPPPLPPPPPPPPKMPPRSTARNTSGTVQRAPQVVEFYHSLMKRDSRKDSSNGAMGNGLDFANARSTMIGEIENRSSHLLAIKADVETQGEFVNSLIQEVKNAVYRDIEDVVAFVKWLDDELCFLVDERAVLKHFDWPEKKADTLREAAFGYRDLKNLEYEVSAFKDDLRLPCDVSLKKMVVLSEKMERSVYNLLRMRDTVMQNFKEFNIPTDWMLDNGLISKIKFGSVKLAKKYMKRVAMELQSKGASSEKDPAMDYMLLQGVRFAFRIHQFAGGFDVETMQAFEELRNFGQPS